MWLIIVGIVISIIVFFYLYQLDKRIKQLESARGPGYSHRFSISVIDAVMSHPKLGEILDIKSAKEKNNIVIGHERIEKNGLNCMQIKSLTDLWSVLHIYLQRMLSL